MLLNLIKDGRLLYESTSKVLKSNYKTWNQWVFRSNAKCNCLSFFRDLRALTEICSKQYY